MLPKGRRLAIDYGEVRVGTAISDALGILASPYQTFAHELALQQIANAVVQEEVAVIYLGIPLNLSGLSGKSAQKAIEFGKSLRALIDSKLPINLIDERLSTKTATDKLTSKGGSITRGKIDQLAAAEILEFALQIEKAQGELAGYELQA